jgi:hypothetical protein
VSHIVHKKKPLIRLVSGVVVAAVTAGSAVLVSGVADATVPEGTLGSLTIQPASGTDQELMSSTTSAPCPNDPNDTRAEQLLVGPVQTDGTAPEATAVFPDSNPYPVTRINSSQFSKTQPFGQLFNTTLNSAATTRGKTLQTGEYHLTTRCLNSSGITVFGTFTGGLIFDTLTHYTVIPSPGGTPTPVVPTPTPVGPTPTPVVPTPTPVGVPTPTPVAGATATTTMLNVIRVPLFFGSVGFAIPIARVTPFNAAGIVQFKDGATDLGGPVRVAGGFVFGGFFLLPAGPHTLTAEFIPDDPAAFQPSTSRTVKFRF